MRLLVSGGGTGGHITPILAVLEALKRHDSSIEVTWVGQAGGMEAKIVQRAGLDFVAIKAGKFRRHHAGHIVKKIFDPTTFGLNARDSARVVAGVYQSIGVIRRLKPDAIFIKGGYVGLPLGIAAGWLRVPYIIHESDLMPGLANRTLAKRAARIAVGFPTKSYQGWPTDKVVYTGNPVRSELLRIDPAQAKRHFGLVASVPVVLVTGGSQGARQINQAIVQVLPQLVQQFQIIHLAGEREIEAVKFQTGRLKLSHPERYQVFAFLAEEMAQALAAADVVISRAGATTISELALLDKPTILIPLAGHQAANAQMLARAGAVVVIGEDRLNSAVLLRELTGIVDSDDKRQSLVVHLREFAVPDAADRLAREILEVAGGAK